jgi:hypothetical protein
MIFTTQVKNEYLFVECVAPTVAEPGQTIKFEFRFSAIKTCKIKLLQWVAPLTLKSELPSLEIMDVVESGLTINKEITFFTTPSEEGFGEIIFTIHFETLNSLTLALEFPVWISVFKKMKADSNGLSDQLRLRLVSVVNARVRNGHIFLADYVSFFRDFLNIEVPDGIAKILAEDFGLPNEGLPVDKEIYTAIINGNITFYGIEKLELINEEECVQSDDKFDLDEMREVKLEKI